jgi:hypothetical protein
MTMIGEPAPEPVIEQWVQGKATSLHELAGRVVLIEMIQLNCTGCFVHALPEAIRLHEKYQHRGLTVLAIATAFEHFENNTLENLVRFINHGELQGAPKAQLENAGYLENGRLPYTIPFRVAMDKLVVNEATCDDKAIHKFILQQVPDYDQPVWSQETRDTIWQRAEQHLKNKQYHALTFEQYPLQGTPSSIVIDRNGILQSIIFGIPHNLETELRRCLDSPP